MIHFVGGVQGQNYKTSATVQIPKDITVFKKKAKCFSEDGMKPLVYICSSFTATTGGIPFIQPSSHWSSGF